MITYIFAKCGAKVLFFCQPTKYFLYFCLQNKWYEEETFAKHRIV